MKNVRWRIFELFVHLAILLILVLVTTRSVGAQTKAITPSIVESTGAGQKVTTQSGMVATEAAEIKFEYQLPYHGLLPDHPLYFLKALRDRIIDFLVADTLKEAEFTLLSADKRLSMAIALIDNGKQELAESTASKGQNYLSRSISLLDKAKSEGKDVDAFRSKLRSSLRKHEEVLSEFVEKTSGNIKERFIAMATATAKYRESLQDK